MSTVAPPACLAWIPRGVPVDAASFSSRHRLLVGVLVLHLLVLSAWTTVVGAHALTTTGGLVGIAVALVVSLSAPSLVVRASAVALGLMEGAGIAVMLSGGLTDTRGSSCCSRWSRSTSRGPRSCSRSCSWPPTTSA